MCSFIIFFILNFPHVFTKSVVQLIMEIGDWEFACLLFCLVYFFSGLLILVTLWLCYSCKHCKYSAIKKCNLNKQVDITHEGFLLLNYTQIRVYNVDHCDTLQCATSRCHTIWRCVTKVNGTR